MAIPGFPKLGQFLAKHLDSLILWHNYPIYDERKRYARQTGLAFEEGSWAQF